MIDSRSPNHFYETLFQIVEQKAAVKFDPETLTAIIGFEVGGPIALRTAAQNKICVTSELAMYPEQMISAEGLQRYELMTDGHFELDIARTLLTAVGAMSLSTTLGDGHTIDVSAVTDGEGPSTVVLSLYAKIEFEGSSYGIYRLSPAT
ncbi:hypothetical protein [Agrobacterium sp. NPDC089420]|uniref:hypothetical protein n=1 Tax=Agrobacterium sp. NPDC089420 TaxID=3363918 RepID=UPI00384C754E